jgi:Ribosome inactivating protein
LTSYFTRARSRALALVLALAMAVAALVSVGSPALAVTPANSISHAFINLQDSPSATMQSQYRTFLQSIQNAAGSPFRGSVFRLQQPSTALIAVDVTSSSGHRVRLLLTPDNLYVRGFITQSGTIWQFSPGGDSYDLTQDLNTLFANHADLSLIGTGGVSNNEGTVNQLAFGSDYTSMQAAAGRGRSTMPISYNDLNGSVNQLAFYAGGDTQATARSLMFMIQFVSEATRLNQVRGTMLTAMGTFDVQQGLPAEQESLENRWGQLSQYAIDVTNNSAIAPRTIGAAGTLTNFGQVAAFLSTMLGVPSEETGSPNHDEL